MKVVTVAEMRAIEAGAVRAGLSSAEMMARAGAGLAEAVSVQWDVKGRVIVVLAGAGNNGGDGLIAARHWAAAGADVRVYLVGARAAENGLLAPVQAHVIGSAAEDADGARLRAALAEADVVVDALVGIGARLPLAGDVARVLAVLAQALSARNAPERPTLTWVSGAPEPRRHAAVVAVDCPSGLACDTGEADAGSVRADLTVTLGFPKRGQLRGAGVALCGELVVVDLGLPEGLPEASAPASELVTGEWVRARLPVRPVDAHKDTFGRALIVAGSLMYTGAAALAAEGAYRAGAGVVRLAVPAPLHAALAGQLPEATFVLLPHDQGVIARDAVRILRALKDWDKYKALLVGPGLGQEESTAEFIAALFAGGAGASGKRARIGFLHAGEAEQAEEGEALTWPALVVDADALNLLAQLSGWQKRLPAGSVLTPHVGELSRLSGLEKAEITADREGCAARLAQAWGHVVVLKGAHTVVAGPDGRVMLLPWANPGLARGGTGDVLAGVITGLLAQGLAPYEAAVAGAYVHGLAGELARAELGTGGVLAGEVAHYLAYALGLVAGE